MRVLKLVVMVVEIAIRADPEFELDEYVRTESKQENRPGDYANDCSYTHCL